MGAKTGFLPPLGIPLGSEVNYNVSYFLLKVVIKVHTLICLKLFV